MTAPIVTRLPNDVVRVYDPPAGPRDAAGASFDARANRAVRFGVCLTTHPGTLWERVAEGRGK